MRKEQSTTTQDQLKRQTAKKSQPFLFHLRIQNDSILSEVYLENVERRMYYVMTAGATHEQTAFFYQSRRFCRTAKAEWIPTICYFCSMAFLLWFSFRQGQQFQENQRSRERDNGCTKMLPPKNTRCVAFEYC